MFETELPLQSRYLRTSWLLKAETTLEFPDLSKIRRLDKYEVAAFSDKLRKRNVFARHSAENNFYIKRIGELVDRTVIEVYRPGFPDQMYAQAEQAAELIEQLSILSTTLALRKDVLLRKLGLSASLRPELDVVADTNLRYIRSRSDRVPSAEGVNVDDGFVRRFSKTGFFDLYQFCQSQKDLAKRIRTSLSWLYESRRETRLEASVVKTAIALEALLIISEGESLARSLAERTAFILSAAPETRSEISTIISRFYDVRSGVVHGNPKKKRRLTYDLIEGIDRLVLLLLLVISTNSQLWPSVESLRLWCEKQRWGNPASNVRIPFSHLYLRNALALAGRD